MQNRSFHLILMRVIALLYLFFHIFYLSAQSSITEEELFTKYLHYRERFMTHYIVSGIGPGCSIPFSTRRIEGDEHYLRTGESTLKLGSYIAVLSMEYRIFKEKGYPVDKTIGRLYEALYALNRLDLAAEPNDPTGSFNPRLNGLLIREDFPPGFFDKHSAQLNKNARPWTKQWPSYINGKGTPVRVTRNREEEVNDHHGLAHRYMSHDHAIRILWGLRMAFAMLDDGLNHENRAFQDREVDLRAECQAIYERFITFFESNNWRIKRPNGENVKRGALVYIFKKELRRSLEGFSEKQNTRSRHKRFTLFYGLFHNSFLGISNANAWMNGRMQLETQNLSGNFHRAWDRCLPFGYENYFIPYGMLVHQWQLTPTERTFLMETMLFYLDRAPMEGNFYHSARDFSSYGWATPDRTERPLEDIWLGIFEKGNFSGLDFLLMHNLFHLVFAKELNEPINYNAQKIFKQEWSRMLDRLDKTEKQENDVKLDYILRSSQILLE